MEPREDDEDAFDPEFENGEEEDFDPGFDEEEEEDDEDDLFGVTSDPRTICHLCGGAGFIANPTLAVIGGTPRTVDNGRECPHCRGARKLSGLIPPL